LPFLLQFDVAGIGMGLPISKWIPNTNGYYLNFSHFIPIDIRVFWLVAWVNEYIFHFEPLERQSAILKIFLCNLV
jgi:hypothetical protein